MQCLKKKTIDKLKREIKDKWNDFRKTGLSLFVRIAVCKMKMLLKINFLFMMLPINRAQDCQTMINIYFIMVLTEQGLVKWGSKSQKLGELDLPNVSYITN